MKRLSFFLATLAFLPGASDRAWAGLITSRTALETTLGGTGFIENFESYSFASEDHINTLVSDLSFSTIVTGQGPGLVNPGLVFISSSGHLQWDDVGYDGATSKEIVSAGQSLTIQFTSGTVNAFGVDLRAFPGHGTTAEMQVFAEDNTTLLGTISNIMLPTNGVPVFVGWQDASWIGEVNLTQATNTWSPIIGNLEYGDPPAVPEPSSLALLSAATLTLGSYISWQRRKQSYQT